MSKNILTDPDSVMRVILVNHLLALFRDRPKRGGRTSFVAVIRQGGFKVVTARDLSCCDVVILETTLAPEDCASEDLVRMCLQKYIEWELRF